MNRACTRSVLWYSTSLFEKCSYQPRIFHVSRTLLPNKYETLKHFCLSSVICASKDDLDRQSGSIECDEFSYVDDSSYTNIDYAEITGGDPAAMKKLKALQIEVYMMRQEGENVPSKLTTDDWATLFARNSASSRVKFLNRLWLRETHEKDKKIRKKIANDLFNEKKAAAAKQEPIKLTTSGPVIYNMRYNSIFFRIVDTRIERLDNYRLHQAMMFGPLLLVDCGDESCLSVPKLSVRAIEMKRTWCANRSSFKPFHLIFCNLDPTGMLLQKMRKSLPKSDEPDFPLFFTSKSPWDLYPKDRLVYLTPTAREHLRKFSYDRIYIIGGAYLSMTDPAISRARVKVAHISTAKVPLNMKMEWNMKGYPLPSWMVASIMNEIKDTLEWNYSFRRMAAAKKYQSNAEKEAETKNNTRAELLRSPLFDRINERLNRKKVYDLLLKKKKT